VLLSGTREQGTLRARSSDSWDDGHPRSRDETGRTDLVELDIHIDANADADVDCGMHGNMQPLTKECYKLRDLCAEKYFFNIEKSSEIFKRPHHRNRIVPCLQGEPFDFIDT